MFPSVYCKFPDAFFGVGDLSKEARVGRWIAIIDALAVSGYFFCSPRSSSRRKRDVESIVVSILSDLYWNYN